MSGSANSEASDRVRDGIETILRAYYPGSGSGRPRVPQNIPLRLADLQQGLLAVCAVERLDDRLGKDISESALLCYELAGWLLETCARVRASGEVLLKRLREAPPRFGPTWDQIVEGRLAEGALPFPNSEICPVSSYGHLEAGRLGNPPELVNFAEAHLRDYEELDELGNIANEWARKLALAARRLVEGF